MKQHNDSDKHSGADDKLMTARELAGRWATSPGRLANDRSSRRGVPFVKLNGNGSIRYRLSDVLAFEAASLVTTLDAA